MWGVGKGRSCRLHYNSRNADPLTYLFQADETSRDYAKNGLHTTFKQADVADVKYRLSNILTNFFSRQVNYFARASIFFNRSRFKYFNMLKGGRIANASCPDDSLTGG